jgi:hypothetical protein
MEPEVVFTVQPGRDYLCVPGPIDLRGGARLRIVWIPSVPTAPTQHTLVGSGGDGPDRIGKAGSGGITFHRPQDVQVT